MAKQEQKTQAEKNERIYVIPLRRRYQHVAIYKKTPKAVKTIKEFLAKHMKIRDRDLRKIKLDIYLNEFLWNKGIKNPPHKIRVKAIKEKDKDGNEIVRAELIDFTDKLKYKKARIEKKHKKSEETEKKKKAEQAPAQDTEKTEETKEDKTEKSEKEKTSEQSSKEKKPEESKKEDKAESGVKKTKREDEKKASVAEEAQKRAKQSAKQSKHATGGKQKQKTAPKRKEY